MTSIQAGDILPEVSFDFLPSTEGDACVYLPIKITNEKIQSPSVIVVVPGAFTPTCSEKHIPAYLTTSAIELLKKSGVKNLYILSVESPFITRAWGEQLIKDKPEVAKYIYDGYIKFISDAGARFLSTVGLVGEPTDLYAKNGLRGLRSAIIVGNGGKIEYVGVDRTRGTVVDSGIDAVLSALNK
ncbi:hypothetical protein C6P40_001494 [Pichia californica]|uniref:Thioredoxin domain-containing protein n=1 Tax=Pichia californica TaxID=460514 RepID=A0A9P6WPA0_9ASCO|nr:hypothetical protein C6P42_002999 [[Candida] californica]KAG0690762.1 hypothetical protein C6P40_001494 [[Candida] californica]